MSTLKQQLDNFLAEERFLEGFGNEKFYEISKKAKIGSLQFLRYLKSELKKKKHKCFPEP
jgi:hypothetical protein